MIMSDLAGASTTEIMQRKPSIKINTETNFTERSINYNRCGFDGYRPRDFLVPNNVIDGA